MTSRDPVDIFAEHRAVLLDVAYRIVGQVADAEDVVQDAWLRWATVNIGEIREPRAFLVRVTTRLAIDRLRRRKARHEAYVGEWLPDPFLTRADMADDVVFAESVSTAMMVVLETLSPLERAVFVLREGFGLSHAEVAQALNRSEASVRQLAKRARDHVDARRPRFDTNPTIRRAVTERFMAASSTGDLGGLLQVLAPGVTLVADSGGLVRAPRLPIVGADKVARLLVTIAGQPLPDRRIELVDLNGGPGILVRSGETPVAAITLDVLRERVARIYLVANPGKLAMFGTRRPG
ncbi:MAG: RNA polymerase sigma factor SigJ [Acidimicrobiales bacterium]